MSAPTYSELLKDPRWQRRRLEILNRANFQCEECEADNQTLHVHHKLYRKGAKPWEYAPEELQCLCEDCHRGRHGLSGILQATLARLSLRDLEQVLGYARGLIARGEIEPSDREEEEIRPEAYELASECYGAGFLDALWIDYNWLTLEKIISQSPISAVSFWNKHVEDSVSRMRRIKAQAE